METNTENTETRASRFTVSDEGLKKLREIPKLPEGWTPMIVSAVSVKDAQSGKYGLQLTHVPIPSMESSKAEAKKSYKTFNTLWAWFKDPGNKARKPGNTFGLWESFAVAHGVSKPSDGSSIPAIPRRNKATDKLELDGEVISKPEADKLYLAKDRWLNECFIEMLELAEQKASPHPLENYAAFAKITHSAADAAGRSFQNIATFRSSLPDDAVLIDLDRLGKSDEDADAEES